MTPPVNDPSTLSTNNELTATLASSHDYPAEIVFTHNSEGQYLSFFWKAADCYNIQSEKIVGSPLAAVFSPVEPKPYLARIQEVLSTRLAQQFSAQFHYGEQLIPLDLVMSPVLLPDRVPTTVMVTGRLHMPKPKRHKGGGFAAEEAVLPTKLTSHEKEPELSISADRHHKLLTQIAWNIRRTLDLPTIWQQTVEGLGEVLGVSRCIVCSYQPDEPMVNVAAEYCRGVLCPMVGLTFSVAEDPDLRSAIATLKPINVRSQRSKADIDALDEPVTLRSLIVHSMLVVTTCYQDQPNGLIVLYQDDQPRRWTEIELEFVQELADQVGTAIAHANLIAASQALATELQRANSNLLQKQRDLEEARRQAEEASRLKSEFLANTSHELRTPLNGMIGFLKLILDGMADDPEEQQEFIGEAYRSALHLLSIINDILDIAKIEAGKLQIELSPVKLSELLNDVEDFITTQVRQKNLSFEIQKPPTDDEIILYGNYQRLLQVMLNLVGNAIKFTHEGGVTVSVEIIKKKVTVQGQELPGSAKVRVADTGIGVSLDKQDKLFQSFSQVDGSRTRQYGGTGLGLAISQKLVEAMGGVVNFYSMGEGLGSTVTFTVPLYQEPVMITTQATDGLDLLL
ncbi:MAG: GAF domain-containing protein [Oscillatoriales cyanobacterium C42_A2020_001]|nr:GAF domain-containing protein [Leptolyngbyaceae cyanobacterium C42_A2020_001]